MSQLCHVKTPIHCVAVVMLVCLPALAHAAGLYKCVDEKTKAVTYSGIPCMTGDVSALTVTENAVIDGRALEREIVRRKTAEQASQGSGCSFDAIQSANAGLAQAEDRAQWADLHNNPHSQVISGKQKREAATEAANAHADYDAAAIHASAPCDPGVAQQAKAAREAAEARINAANAAEEDRKARIRAANAAAIARAEEAEQERQLRDVSSTLDAIRQDQRWGDSVRQTNKLNEISGTLDSIRSGAKSVDSTQLRDMSRTLDAIRQQQKWGD